MLAGLWFISGWLIYELLPSKLPAYAITAHIPIAFLISKQIEELNPEMLIKLSFKIISVFHYLFVICLAGAFITVPFILEFRNSYLLILTGILYIIIATVSMIFLLRRDISTFVKTLLFNGFILSFFAWCIVLPSIDELKDSTKRVASFLKEKADTNCTIVIANNTGTPPSFPFYLSEYFTKIEEDYELESINEKYNNVSPYAFIMKESDAKILAGINPEIKIHSIKSFNTDRLEGADYSIIINKAGEN
ncbi:MAG: hypothetical protein HY738_17880 [Bacteroidia bacterium]|nr:hypothetical protein [Bacteroidia bacterium]